MIRPRASGAHARAASSNRRPTPRRWTSSSTANSESPQMPSRTSASATPAIAPSCSATQAPPGSVVRRCSIRARLRRAALGLRLDRAPRGTAPAGRGRPRPPRRPRASAGSRSGSPRAPVKQAAMGYPLGSHGRPEAEAVAQPHAPSAARSTRSRAPTYNACPQCHSPRRPHRVCPTCGTYAGREVVRARRSTTTTITTTSHGARARVTASTVAVDANGADLGPAEVAAGAAMAAAQGVRVLLFGPAGELGDVAGPASRSSTRPVSIAKAPDPASAVRSTPGRLDRPGRPRGRRRRRATRSSAGGSTGAALAAGLFNIKRARGIYRPGAGDLRSPCPASR